MNLGTLRGLSSASSPQGDHGDNTGFRKPRRQMLLGELGWNIKVVVPETDESQMPEESPKRWSGGSPVKAHSVHVSNPTADRRRYGRCCRRRGIGQTVGTRRCSMYDQKLQGKKHAVITGIALFAPGGRRLVEAEETM